MRSFVFIVIVSIMVAVGSCSNQKSNNDTRDYAYEAYCDSIWEANPDYYLDVIMEQDEYCTYIEEHGTWW